MEGNNFGMTDLPEVRMTLIGKTGVGKSASGNTILGANLFHSEQGSSSVTTKCVKQSAVVGDRRITVVDTPDVFYGTQEENLSSEIERSIRLASPGVHAVLYVLALTTFTEQENDYTSLCKLSFGEEVMRYIVVLFTYGDKLDNRVVETMIDENHLLQDFVNECGGRYHVLDNNDLSNRDQVMNLLEKIDRMIVENGNSCYTIEMLHKAERRAEEQLEWIEREKLRLEELEKIKHERDLEKAKRVAEERVRKEMEPQLQRLRRKIQAKEESMERTEELKEREKKNRDISYTEQWKRFREAISQSKQKYFLVMSVLIIITMGGINVQTTAVNSEKFKAFRQGCLSVVLPMSLGAVSARAWVFIRRRISKPVFTSSRAKVIGVLCGFAAGAIPHYRIGGDNKEVLLAGLFGGYGAICFSSDNSKDKEK